MYVIGTAGHVDHGKSTLVQALTGIDPDRLQEEKDRGLTIDIGFAWLTLPSGREVSIVDVPGHERFIKNMLVGAGGVDLALLVVAADEGPMPQTREHLGILALLGIRQVVGVVSRCDLVDAGFAELVQVEVEGLLAEAGYPDAAVLRVSAVTGEGLPALQDVVDTILGTLPPKRDIGRPRLPVDRVFSRPGFGTVVTGTLLDGGLDVGDEVELQPGAVRGRVRGLQRHRSSVPTLAPGTRAAVNLSGVEAAAVQRGMVLALPGTVQATSAFDLHLRATPSLSHPLAHDAGVTVLSGTAEAEGRVRLLDRDELLAGEEGWAQVVLAEPMPLVAGDHCILRTPNETAAGGVIVTTSPPRHRRHHPPTLQSLARKLAGTPDERLADLLLAGPTSPGTSAAQLGVAGEEAERIAAGLVAGGQAVLADGMLFGSPWLERQADRLRSVVDAYLRENPLRTGMPRDAVRSSARVSQAYFAAVVRHAAATGALEERDGLFAPPGYTVVLPPPMRAEADCYLAALLAAGASPGVPAPAAELLQYLVAAGDVVVASGVPFHAAVFRGLEARVARTAEERGSITIAEARDLLGTSRKYAQAILEHLDATHVMRREGDRHILRAPAGGRP